MFHAPTTSRVDWRKQDNTRDLRGPKPGNIRNGLQNLYYGQPRSCLAPAKAQLTSGKARCREHFRSRPQMWWERWREGS